jgi:thiamine pyrophosphokinase
MSSHHIVRDEQEPALLILDPESISLNDVHSLLEWSPTVIVSEEALEKVMEWEIKVDVVVCREENIRELTKNLMAQAPVKFLSYPAHEESPVLNAFYFMTANKHKAVNILANLEQQNTIFFEGLAKMRGHIDVVVYSQGQKCHIVEDKFEKWLPKGDVLQIAPVDKDCQLTTHGFESDCNQHALDAGIKLIVKEEGKVSLSSNGKAFWVCEDLS